MNERIKELRKALDLSGDKFGQSIGLTRFAISNIENGRYSITEQTIIAICHIYNVNEDWLRTGKGYMFNRTKGTLLSEIQKQFSLSDFQTNIVKTYLELSDKDKASIDKFINSCMKNPEI